MKKKKLEIMSLVEFAADETAVSGIIMGEDGEYLVPAKSEEEAEEWLDCGWKRIPCGKRSCPICGRIARDQERLKREGKDSDSLQSSLEIVGENLAEALTMIKKDAKAMGIDITNLDEVENVPKQGIFPLAVSAREWHVDITRYGEGEKKHGSTWLMTEAAADLLWYVGTLDVKIYRQLCNLWHKENGHSYGDFDYRYTGKVLRQVIEILNNAWPQVLDLAPSSRKLFDRFRKLAKDSEYLLEPKD